MLLTRITRASSNKCSSALKLLLLASTFLRIVHCTFVSSSTDNFSRFNVHKLRTPSCDTVCWSAVNDETATNLEDPGTDQVSKNRIYCENLLRNLERAVEKWFVSGSPLEKNKAYNIMDQINRIAMDSDIKERAVRMLRRATLPEERPPAVNKSTKYDGSTRGNMKRKSEAKTRKDWEANYLNQIEREKKLKESSSSLQALESKVATVDRGKPRSALSSRVSQATNFMNVIDKSKKFATDKKDLEKALSMNDSSPNDAVGSNEDEKVEDEELKKEAAAFTSILVAKAGAGNAFEGETLGIGGLDDVLAQIKRRIWVPLAAPPSLLDELGINPVRGLLLYGVPGCGKTLLARKLGSIFSPARPITVISGPEIMDKFVGSSEANLREVFDNPPDIHENYKERQEDGGETLSKAALHVIVLDEFDAMARARGGSDGKGGQGDAGVARDSVVNQMLAKMDGVDELVVPTLVIGLTNKRSLIEPALLRPGRFEVQIEVPPPKTDDQRISILRVHTQNMFSAGRVLVSDAPAATAAFRIVDGVNENKTHINIPSYRELLQKLASECEGMSGASLAGVCRAAASRALERSVYNFSEETSSSNTGIGTTSLDDCLVTLDDFQKAVEDVIDSISMDDGEDSNVSASKGSDEDPDSENKFEKDDDGVTEKSNIPAKRIITPDQFGPKKINF